MNEQKIGELAGHVWRYLESHGGHAEYNTIRRQIGTHEGIPVEMGLGWLAREGKISFQHDGDTVRMSLRRS
ncbi:MAG: winged helix-turn-helix domain-containing protein [Deltaproteobacteria bacterium]